MTKEICKEIRGFDGYYISNDGRIFTTKKSNRHKTKEGEWREIKLSNNKSGYKYANIYSGSGKENRHSIRVHRLVWQEWAGLIPEGYYVDHKNANKGDNRLENLQLLTPEENSQKYHKFDKFNKKK